MNPFHYERDWRIPVPGAGGVARSVEGIWQGLKLIAGETDLSMLDQPAGKRPPEHARGPGFDYAGTVFQYGQAVVDLVTARLLIYLPAYLHVLDHLVPREVITEIDNALAGGRDVVFYDWDDNFDILDPTSSFSHSALLAAWFGTGLTENFLRHHHARAGSAGLSVELRRYHELHGTSGG